MQMNWTVAILVAVGVVVFGIVMAVGSYANATGSVLVALIAAAIWVGIVFIPQTNNQELTQVIATIRTISNYAIPVVLVLAMLNLGLGVFSPAIKASLDRWSDNKKQTLANYLDKGSLKSEPEFGTTGTLKEDLPIIEKGKVVWIFKAGAPLKACDLRGKKATRNSSGTTTVVFRGKDGRFNGNEVDVPSRQIDWDS